MSNSGGIMLRCTDRLDDEIFVGELSKYFYVGNDGKVYLVGSDEEVNQVSKGKGYLSVRYGGKYIMTHRLVYALTKGPFYSHIDHIDGNPSNNSISNLRLCDQGLNVANARIRSDNTSGYIGVIWHKASKGRWQAQTMYKGKRIHVGLFTDKEEAALAYNYKITELFGHQCTFNQVFEDHPDSVSES